MGKNTKSAATVKELVALTNDAKVGWITMYCGWRRLRKNLKRQLLRL
jgi:hypothetical protein